MNVLVFLGNDAANFSIEPVLRRLREKHATRIVTASSSLQTLQMFEDIRDEIRSAADLTQQDY